MKREIQPILVAACGNRMAGDDAFGPLVADALRAIRSAGVEILDLGMKPVGVLDHLAGRKALVIVDAAVAGPGFPPGRLLNTDFFSPDIPQLLHDAPLSSHGLSISHELEMAKQLQFLPENVYLVAAAVADATIGRPVSAAVSKLIEPATSAVVQRCAQLLAEPSHA